MSLPFFFFGFICVSLVAQAEDFRLNDGTEYKNVTVSRAEPDGLVVVTSTGIVKLFFSELPESVAKAHGYDPAKAQAFREKVEAANAAAKAAKDERARQRHQEFVEQTEGAAKRPSSPPSKGESYDNPLEHGTTRHISIKGKVLQVLDDGVLIVTESSGRTFGNAVLKPNSTVFVRGAFDGIVDEEYLELVATDAGTVKYASVIGSGNTVRAFNLVRITKQPQR